MGEEPPYWSGVCEAHCGVYHIWAVHFKFQVHNWAAHRAVRRRAPTTMPTSSRSLASVPPALYRTKQELVYRSLRDAILTCELAPDQRLVIDDIARRVSVSTIPVREALQMLQSEGLVTMVPHVRAAVAPLSRESVVDVFSVLEGLQVVAGRLAATGATADELKELSGLVGEMDQAIDSGLYEAWADLNTRFHARIAGIPGLGLLRQSNEQALDRWDGVR